MRTGTNGIFTPEKNSVLIGNPAYGQFGEKYALSVKPTGTIYYLDTAADPARNNRYSVLIYDQNLLSYHQLYSNEANPLPSGWMVLESGKTYYFRVIDSNRGGSYAIRLSDQGFGIVAGDPAPDIDAAEPRDNTSAGASLMILNQTTQHSLSFNDGDFSDEDWFTFTVPYPYTGYPWCCNSG